MRKIFLIIEISLAAVMILSWRISHSRIDKKPVLLLNSYNREMTWTANIVAGVRSILDSNTCDLYIEDMDSKRVSDREYFQLLKNIFVYKYSRHRFDVILVSNNDALNFLHLYGNELFPGVPVVFCGINDFRGGMTSGYPNYTGVTEVVEIKETMGFALANQQGVKRVAVINDRTTTGIALRNLFEMEIPAFKGITFEVYDSLRMSEYEKIVSGFGKDTIIFMLLLNRDAAGEFYTYEESMRRIYESSSVPIYTLWDFYIGHGAVGGKVVSGFFQGKTAAYMALRILHGEKPSGITRS